MSVAAELLGSRVRAVVLNELLLHKFSGSARALAKRVGLAYFPVARELERLVRMGFVHRRRHAAAGHHEAAWDQPVMRCLADLLRKCSFRRESRMQVKDRDAVVAALAEYGAPIRRAGNMTAGKLMPLEATIASAVILSHREATVLRVLPCFLAQVSARLDWTLLRSEANRHDVRHSLGMLLDVAGKLFGQPNLRARAKEFRDRRRTQPKHYLPTENRAEKVMAEKNTPSLIRKWGFLLDMSEESFRRVMDKPPDLSKNHGSK